MTIRRFFLALLLGAGVLPAQEEGEAKPPPGGVSFSDQEIENLILTFDQTYKNKDLPEDDAVATLANLKNAYNFLKNRGDEKTKIQEKLQKDIVEKIAKKGLTARKRPRVNMKCAEILGELGDPAGAAPLVKWLDGILDEKSPNPQAVEYGFQSLAWIGPEDSRTQEWVLDWASKGKHPDNTVPAQAIKACAQWRAVDGKMRKEVFDKISLFLQGLHSNAKGGDPKQRGTYEQRYNAVSAAGLEALNELCTDGTKFKDPDEARTWFGDNKKSRWDDYVGPRFRKAAAPPAKEGGDAKPEG